MITCVITYDIDPFKRAEFIAYGEMWNEIIPRLGVDLVGYFAPHEGTGSITVPRSPTTRRTKRG